MRMFDRAKQMFRALKYSEKFDKWLSNYGTTISGTVVNEDTAFNLSVVYSCVNVISQTIGSLPLILYERINEGKNRATSHYLYDILHNRPNPYMLPATFKETSMAHILTWGNAYSEIEYDKVGRALNLWPIHPSRVQPKKIEGKVFYDVTLAVGNAIRLNADRILHIPGLSFDGIMGTTPIAKSREAFGHALAAQEYGSRFFLNDANPGGVLMAPNKLGDVAFGRLQTAIAKKHEGLENKHRFMILEEGTKWEKIGLSPEDAQMLETRKFSSSEICGMFRITPHKVSNLDRATFCLPAGTMIFGKFGPVPVESVKNGEFIWSKNERNEWILSPVKQASCIGEDKILRFHTTNRTLRTNARHRILIRRKHFKPQYGKGGRRVEWHTEYTMASDIKVGDLLVCLDRLPNFGREDIPTRKASVGFIEFCGLLLGDGNVFPNRGITIARSSNALYMDYYRRVIHNEFQCYDGGNGRGDRRTVRRKWVTLQEGERQTRFSSVLAARELEVLGLCGNAHTKNVPGWVFELSETLRLAFLRGFLDADGSVNKKGRISFTSCNEQMISQIRYLCMSCGIPVTNLRKYEGMTSLPNGNSVAYRQWGFTCSDPGANRRIGSHDIRYQKRLNNGKPFDHKERSYPAYGGRCFNIPGCCLSRVISIRHEPSELVYDLDISDTHNFIADGVVVHNSNVEHLAIEFLTDTIVPWLTKIEEAVNLKLVSESERDVYFSEFLIEGYLRGDTAARTNYYKAGQSGGWLSINDIRRLENMNTIEGGDRHYVPLNLAPIDGNKKIVEAKK